LTLRKVVDQSSTTRQPVTVQLESTIDTRDDQRVIEVTCSQIEQSTDEAGAMTLVSVADVTDREQLRKRQEHTVERAANLAAANEQALEANQQLSAIITRLSSENEELLVASEEVQAATEEVETLNEELQATNEELETLNEELETLNEELQATVEELNTTNEDLQARTVELQALALESNMSQIQMRVVLDAIDDTICLVNNAGAIEVSNSAWLRYFGRQDLQLSVFDLERPPVPRQKASVARAARREPFTMFFGTRTENHGEASWFGTKGKAIFNDEDRQVGFLTIREIDAPVN
jgi:two-component system CheB/CheR fusion protein